MHTPCSFGEISCNPYMPELTNTLWHGSDVQFPTFEVGRTASRGLLLHVFEVTSQFIFLSPSVYEASQFGRYVAECRVDYGRMLIPSLANRLEIVEIFSSVAANTGDGLVLVGVERDISIPPLAADPESSWVEKLYWRVFWDWQYLDTPGLADALVRHGYDSLLAAEDSELGYSVAFARPESVEIIQWHESAQAVEEMQA